MKTKQTINTVLFLLAALPTMLWSQNQSVSWAQIKEERGIKLFYALGNCGPTQNIWLRAENSRDTTVMVRLTLQVVDNNQQHFIPEQRIEVAARGITLIDCDPHGPNAMPINFNVQNREGIECKLLNLTVTNLIR